MDLDNVYEIEKIDSLGMFRSAESFPAQIMESFSLANVVLQQVKKAKFSKIVGCGMGGSAIGLELVRSWLQMELTVPFLVIRDYGLPRYVGKDDLVLVVSYSGDTEETLSCMVEAAKRGSFIISMSSGGELERFSRVLNIPHFMIPSGCQPRTALGYLFTLPLILLVHLGFAHERNLKELLDSINTLKEMAKKCSYNTPTSKNPAKQLAVKLFGSFPIIYGYGSFAAAALRFKQQLNENGKMLAKYEAFPELDHNDIEGFDLIPNNLRPILVVLKNVPEPHMMAKVAETVNVLRERVADVVEVKGFGSGITQLLTTIQTCDFASLFLACLRGIDPGPVNRIKKMKMALASRIDLVRLLKAEVERLSGHKLA
ncbi:MAG: bifunctional phosphoglucose/phosphomannose isomerase [Thermoproteota archaeon]